jgi:probable addiction module antidote protein
MNKDLILKHTASYDEYLYQKLKDPDFAHTYLETALEDYKEDGDTQALLLALRDIAKAQGGIGQLSKRTGISRQHLYDVLASKHNPRLDNLLSILSALGFQIRLERQETVSEPFPMAEVQ